MALSASTSWLRKALLFLFFLACLYGVWVCYRWFMADWLAREINDDLGQWRSSGTISTLQQWLDARDLADRAISLKPEDPDYYRLRGLVYEWRLLAPWTEPGKEDDFDYQAFIGDTHRQMVASYRRAVALRPGWPYGWVQLAQAKGLANEFDDEFRTAFTNITRYGKYFPDARKDAAQIVILYPDAVLGDERVSTIALQVLHTSFANRDRTQAKALLEFLDNHGKLAMFCLHGDPFTLSREVQQACSAQSGSAAN